MKTKFENELDRAMREEQVRIHMRTEYLARKQLLLTELREINAMLEKL
jgi:hypothetical protein